jgi:hypothetical protein
MRVPHDGLLALLDDAAPLGVDAQLLGAERLAYVVQRRHA